MENNRLKFCLFSASLATYFLYPLSPVSAQYPSELANLHEGPGETTIIYVNNLYNTDGRTVTKNIYVAGELVATIKSQAGSTTVGFVHSDHLGSVNAVTDENGKVVNTLDYFPYGSERVSDGPEDQQRTYIGQHYDTESNLQYLNARYYDPARGQFLSQDPMFWARSIPAEMLIDPQQQNSYNYARNNPINRSDPSGQASIKALLSSLVQGLTKLANGLKSIVGKSVNSNTGIRTSETRAPNYFLSDTTESHRASGPKKYNPSGIKEYNAAFANVEESILGKKYKEDAESNGPDVFDCSGAIIFGIRQTVNALFGDHSADDLYNNFAIDTDDPYGRGTVTFYSDSEGGKIKHVTTNIGGGWAVNPYNEEKGVVKSSTEGVADYFRNLGGQPYYMQLNWEKIMK